MHLAPLGDDHVRRPLPFLPRFVATRRISDHSLRLEQVGFMD
jgi:hypothetical protein